MEHPFVLQSQIENAYEVAISTELTYVQIQTSDPTMLVVFESTNEEINRKKSSI